MSDGWNDGITKMMNDYLKSLENLGDEAIDAFKKTIDDAVDTYNVNISPEIPYNSGELKASFTVEEDRRGSKYYGYKAYFKGENSDGQPFEKIANVLNYGRKAGETKSGRKYGAITGTHFITNAIRNLKGLNDRINENIDAVLKEKT